MKPKHISYKKLKELAENSEVHPIVLRKGILHYLFYKFSNKFFDGEEIAVLFLFSPPYYRKYEKFSEKEFNINEFELVYFSQTEYKLRDSLKNFIGVQF